MNIWIIGAAGFVGTRLGRSLRDAGHNVVGVSRRHSQEADESHRLDLSRTDSIGTVKALLSRSNPPDVVINAASRQPGPGTLADFTRSNAVAIAYLLESLEQSPPRLFIHLSTQSVYAQTSHLPLDEDRPATASGAYPASKRLGEQIAQTFKGSPVVVLRLPSLYGKGQSDSFIDGFARTALANEPLELYSNGQLIRDTLHISDVIHAIALLINAEMKESNYILNLGCGSAVRTIEYAQTLTDVLGSQSEILCVDRPASQFDLYADIGRAHRLIGFQPTGLRESLQRYADELRA